MYPNIKIAGDIPLDINIRETSDSGKPVVVSSPDGPQAKAYVELARNVLLKLPGL